MSDAVDIRVVRGEPNAEELAAAIAVVQAALAAAEFEAADAAKRKPNARSTWNRNHGMLRTSLQVGPNQWGASFKDGLN
ncbi:MAG: acyl-CoA carboxylase epsilon subunit [Microbacteriaceae bacterium]